MEDTKRAGGVLDDLYVDSLSLSTVIIAEWKSKPFAMDDAWVSVAVTCCSPWLSWSVKVTILY